MNSTKAMTAEDMEIRTDRMRFIKNHLSANLALLAILFDVFYFVTVYRQDVGSYYYNIIIGASIIYNLLFMLTVFLCSEGVKNYKIGYGYVAVLLGLLQAGRIFYLPLNALNAPNPKVDAESATVMTGGQFSFVAICLGISAVLLIAAGITGIMKTMTLNSYRAELEKNSKRD